MYLTQACSETTFDWGFSIPREINIYSSSETSSLHWKSKQRNVSKVDEGPLRYSERALHTDGLAYGLCLVERSRPFYRSGHLQQDAAMFETRCGDQRTYSSYEVLTKSRLHDFRLFAY